MLRPVLTEVALFVLADHWERIQDVLGFITVQAEDVKETSIDVSAKVRPAVGVPMKWWTVVTQEIMLLVVGGLFFIEAASVVLQVGSYRLRGGKRIFRCAPLHHHFQFKGWEDPKITVRFWIIASILAILGLSSLKLR